jgi:glycosyltransferase involved in cell wall biosynthesis
MKILMLAGYYPPDIRGGGEISGKLLADILIQAGADVSVLTCSAEERDEMLDGARVKRVLSPNAYWNFYPDQPKLKKIEWYARENVNPRARKVIRAFIDEVQPDIVLTSTIENFGAEAWAAPMQAKVPTVHVLRSYYPFCWQGSAVKNSENCAGKCLDCRALTFGRRRASQYVNGVVGISKYILQRHLDEGTFLNATSAIIPEPITADLIALAARTSSQARFGYLGILRDDKGLGTLLEAWKSVSHPNATLVIAGKGSPEYETELQAKLPGNARFLGWVDSSEYLANVDFLIVPSVWHEPFGRIVIEAFAKGVPVIGSRIGGIAETIRNGENGFLFTPRSATELARHIEQCAALDAQTYSQLSHRAHSDTQAYEAKRIAHAHLDFYERISRETNFQKS